MTNHTLEAIRKLCYEFGDETVPLVEVISMAGPKLVMDALRELEDDGVVDVDRDNWQVEFVERWKAEHGR